MVVGMMKNAEMLTRVRVRNGQRGYITQRGKQAVFLLQSESRCPKIKVLYNLYDRPVGRLWLHVSEPAYLHLHSVIVTILLPTPPRRNAKLQVEQ
jgi:hypothetical protein